MPEQLKNHETAESSELNPWMQMAKEAGEFNVNPNSEKPNFTAEELKDVNNVIAQLEAMGAQSSIVENPAFSDIIKKLILETGYKYGAQAELTENSNLKNSFELESQRDRSADARTGNNAEDLSWLQYQVEQNGDVAISYAYANREHDLLAAEGSFAKFFNSSQWQYPVPKGSIKFYQDRNISGKMHFSQLQNREGIYYTKTESYEQQDMPSVVNPACNNVGEYSQQTTAEVRCFDTEGKELSVETTKFKPRSFEGKNILSLVLGQESMHYAPKTVRYNSYNLDHTSNLESQSVTRAKRTSEDTLDYATTINGTWTEAKNYPIDNRESKNLIPSSEAALLEKLKQEVDQNSSD